MRVASLAGIVPSAAVQECYRTLDPDAPDDYRQLAPLLVEDWLSRGLGRIGLGGGQGAGKSTLARLIQDAGTVFGKRIEVLGIDDFYLTKAERERLGREVHPLLATRGPPGTHAVALAQTAVAALGGDGPVEVPRFDKGIDDRVAPVVLQAPADIVVLEGWCVGARPAEPDELEPPINALEREDDAEGIWRSYVNDALRCYEALFNGLDALVFLQVPSIGAVRRWRLQQEGERAAAQRMTAAEVSRFVEHYERITLRMLRDLPAHADTVVGLDAEHRVAALGLGRSRRSSGTIGAA